MKIFAFVFVILSVFCFSFINNYTAYTVVSNETNIQTYKDSSLTVSQFITLKEVENLFNQPCLLKDSVKKYSGNILRFTFTYLSKSTDEATKSKLFFVFEQYKDNSMVESIYAGLKKENEANGKVKVQEYLGEEAIIAYDSNSFPFLIIRKENKLYKIKVYNVLNEEQVNSLTAIASKIVKTH
jgi:hypothetical protein